MTLEFGADADDVELMIMIYPSSLSQNACCILLQCTIRCACAMTTQRMLILHMPDCWTQSQGGNLGVCSLDRLHSVCASVCRISRHVVVLSATLLGANLGSGFSERTRAKHTLVEMGGNGPHAEMLFENSGSCILCV